MKEIPLTRGKVAIVDDDDFERVNAFNWHALWNGSNWYAVRSGPRYNGKRETVYMHRSIVQASGNVEVDHAHHNTLDNRKSELRICSTRQNQANRRLGRDSASGFKGVSWRECKKKWRATIKQGGRAKHLGYFSDPLRAALAYNNAAREEFGEFALTNFQSGRQ